MEPGQTIDLCPFFRPADHGDWGVVTHLTDRLLARGTSSQRQRGALGRGATARDLVSGLADETTP